MPQKGPSRGSVMLPLAIYPMFGPALMMLAVALPPTILGLVAMGPAGILWFVFTGIWWLPHYCPPLALPFLLTGLMVALSGRLAGRWSLLVALLAACLAFLAYFGLWHLASSAMERVIPDHAKLLPALSRSYLSGPYLLGTAIGCWFITRDLARRMADPSSVPAGPPPRYLRPLLSGALVIGAGALVATLATIPPSPEAARRACRDGGHAERLRACSVIIGRPQAEPAGLRARAHLNRGKAHEFTYRDLASAVADYTAAIDLDPALAEAHGLRGLAFARQGDDARAIADIDRALALDPAPPAELAYQLYRHRGLAHARRGAFDRAIADHGDEIRLKPFYAEGYLHRGAAHLGRQQIAQAIADFNDAIRVEPWRADGYVARGRIHLQQGDADKALADADEAIRRGPDLSRTAPAYRLRGMVLERRGDRETALAAFEKALALAPGDAEAQAARDRLRATGAR